MCPDFFTPPFRSCRKTVKVIACAFKNFSQTIWQASWMKNPISVLSNMSTFRGACQTIGFPQNFYSSQKEKKVLLKLFTKVVFWPAFFINIYTFFHQGFFNGHKSIFFPWISIKKNVDFLKFLASNKNFVWEFVPTYYEGGEFSPPCPSYIAEK